MTLTILVSRELTRSRCSGEYLSNFEVRFENRVRVRRMMCMSTQAPTAAEVKLPRAVRVGVVAARFNAKLVDELLAGCLRRLKELGVGEDHVEVWRVPGAFELPVAAQAVARSGRVWAVICLGAV